MTGQQILDLLSEEQDKYTQELKEKGVEYAIEHSYETAIKDEIIFRLCEQYDWDGKEVDEVRSEGDYPHLIYDAVEALHKKGLNALQGLYNAWLDEDTNDISEAFVDALEWASKRIVVNYKKGDVE